MNLREKSLAYGTVALAVLTGFLLLPPAIGAQEADNTFRQNCMSCHTIGGGRLVGPDLKGVEERKDRDWLVAFIMDPKGVLASGDLYALKLKEEAGGVIMPTVVGLTPERAAAMLDLIAAESQLEASQFAGLDIGDEPFAEIDIELGRQMFRGRLRLVNSGPACMSCHTVAGLGGLGGGRLGPDLTRVYERLQGRKNLASWLLAPATETMQPIYAKASLTNEEILPLVAFLEEEARTGKEDTATAQVSFLLLGLAGAALGFVAADLLWRGRLRGVRRPLVRGEQ
jgi:mono/diheme cytochrome c family protein